MFHAILLASGRGSRFDPHGQRNKLLAPLANGEPVIAAAARALCAVFDHVCVVMPPHPAGLRAALAGLPLNFIDNPRAAEGMGASIAAGVAATPDAGGWIIALGDMPFIQPSTLLALRNVLLAGDALTIAAPTWQGQRGHPVAFGRGHRAALAALTGDSGARALLTRHPVQLVAVDDSGILRDIDTPADLTST